MRAVFSISALATCLALGMPLVLAQSQPGEKQPSTAQPIIKKEPLGEVNLPHGEILIPTPDSKEAVSGNFILNLADGKLHTRPPMPEVKPGEKSPSLLDVLRSNRTGDLLYARQNGGSLLVISGKVTDLDSRYYFNLPNSDMPSPLLKPAAPGDPSALPGTINPVEPGHIYLIETVDGHYAAIRVLDKQPDTLLIQYIYQPGNSLNFCQPPRPLDPVLSPSIATMDGVGLMGGGTPRANPETPRNSPAATPAPAADDPLAHVLTPNFMPYVMQQRKLVQARLDILRNISTSEKAVEYKVTAMQELGQLRAEDAVGLLIDNITLMNPQGRDKLFSVENYHPAVGALRNIGKPASIAAVEAINHLNPADNDQSEPLLKADYKLRLLSLVILGVEGPETGEFMLTKAMEKADTIHRPLFEKAIRFLKMP